MAVRYPASRSWVTNVGWSASKWVTRVVTPLTWLYVPVRMEARLGAHSELVA